VGGPRGGVAGRRGGTLCVVRDERKEACL